MKTSNDDSLPYFIKNWNQFYTLVVVWLVFLITIFWLITRSFE